MRSLVLRLAAAAVSLAAVPVALIAIPTVPCPTGPPGLCHVVSYPRLGVMVLVVALGLLLWAIADSAEGPLEAVVRIRPRRGGPDDPA